jgi:hypothetical protein
VVLTQFNYARGYGEGLEFKAKYQNDGVTAYANVLTSRAKAIDVVSNQYLFDDPVEFAYIANNYHFIDNAQLITASAGASAVAFLDPCRSLPAPKTGKTFQ